MNSLKRSIASLALGGWLALGVTGAWAASRIDSRSASDNNPYNSAVRAANPNSRQGTVSTTPSVQRDNPTSNPRPPTLENGGIGNGYPTRQQPSFSVPDGSPSNRAPQR
ncbi:hypothetical protein [Pseudomonas sp. NA-150]|uniref:hypothetical protein n=1 Tax=Pseudomonas sp. NA-150 TaxID=3367525 RepID=UPI0037CB02A1